MGKYVIDVFVSATVITASSSNVSTFCCGLIFDSSHPAVPLCTGLSPGLHGLDFH